MRTWTTPTGAATVAYLEIEPPSLLTLRSEYCQLSVEATSNDTSVALVQTPQLRHPLRSRRALLYMPITHCLAPPQPLSRTVPTLEHFWITLNNSILSPQTPPFSK